MMENVFFINTYLDYHVNGTNRAYWVKLFKPITAELKESGKMRLNSSYNENMPIYEYYSAVKRRFVRIMQYDPHDEIIKSDKYSSSRFYTAWIDNRLLSGEDIILPELVICLLMTKDNITKAEQLIHSWLFEEDRKTKMIIEKIYAEQDRMDSERNV